MEVTIRRVVSVEDATAKLIAIARRCNIANPRFDEAEADSMTEFDALEWICLCSQRIALQTRERENASRDCSVNPIIRNLYGSKSSSKTMKLENSEEGYFKLAA